LVRFFNVPAYRHAANIVVDVPGVTLHGDAVARGGIRVDLAFGGAYYGIVDAAELGVRVVPEQIGELTRIGAAITDALRRDHTQPTRSSSTGLPTAHIVTPTPPPPGRPRARRHDASSLICGRGGGPPPCGSGTSALPPTCTRRVAAIGQSIVNASITGEAFEARWRPTRVVDDRPAVTTSVAGRLRDGYGSPCRRARPVAMAPRDGRPRTSGDAGGRIRSDRRCVVWTADGITAIERSRPGGFQRSASARGSPSSRIACPTACGAAGPCGPRGPRAALSTTSAGGRRSRQVLRVTMTIPGARCGRTHGRARMAGRGGFTMAGNSPLFLVPAIAS
jgi:hypothetical protein